MVSGRTRWETQYSLDWKRLTPPSLICCLARLSEILDFGYPQTSETDTLKMYITTEGVKSEQAVREDSAKITIQATGATSWRRADVKYRKNEAFVDVVENVNLLMSTKGEWPQGGRMRG